MNDLLITTLDPILPGSPVVYIPELGRYIKATNPVRLFLDDQWDLPDRYPGSGWTCVRTVQEAQAILRFYRGRVTHLSLDSDLGAPDGLEGPDLTAWLSAEYFVDGNDFWPTAAATVRVGRRWRGISKTHGATLGRIPSSPPSSKFQEIKCIVIL